MQRIEPLPAAFSRFRDIHGVVEFAIFEDADGDPDTVFDAICAVGPIDDADALRAIGFRAIEEATFFGDWYDAVAKRLLLIGTYTFHSGETLTNPALVDLVDKKVLNGGSPVPEIGGGGQFAYAFSHPPYGLAGDKREIQELFDKIRHVILPDRTAHEILDWSGPDLGRVSNYFAAGAEWWGVFLMSIYLPEYRRLIILHAAATD